jgi:hypothetical protein
VDFFVPRSKRLKIIAANDVNPIPGLTKRIGFLYEAGVGGNMPWREKANVGAPHVVA